MTVHDSLMDLDVALEPDDPASPEPITSAPADAHAPPPTAPRPTSWDRRAAAGAGWALVGFVVAGALWQLGASRVPQLATPGETFGKLRELLAEPFYDNGPNDKGIGLHLYGSLQRVAFGFGLAMLVGVPLGFAIGASRRLWQAANPVIQVLRPVSPLAWFPIWLMSFRDAGRAAIWVIFITALWPAVLNTAAGVAAVPNDQRDVAKVFRFGRLAYLRHVLIPNTLPSVVTGMRVSMGIAWMVIVAVEMLSSGGAGIGRYVWEQYNALKFPAMTAAIVLIGAVGFVLDLAFLRLGRAVAIEEPRA